MLSLLLTKQVIKDANGCTIVDEDEVICPGTVLPEKPELYETYKNDECIFEDMKSTIHKIVCNTHKPITNFPDTYFYVELPHEEDENEKCRVYKNEDFIYCPDFEDPFYAQEYNITNGHEYFRAVKQGQDYKTRVTKETHNIAELFFNGILSPNHLNPDIISRIDYEDAKKVFSLIDLDKKSGIENIEILEGEEKGELVEDYMEEPTFAPNEKITFKGVDNDDIAEIIDALKEVMNIFNIDSTAVSNIFINPESTWGDIYKALGIEAPTAFKLLNAFNNLVHNNQTLIAALDEFGFQGKLYEDLIKSTQKLLSTENIESSNFVDFLSKVSPAFDDFVTKVIKIAPQAAKEVFIAAYNTFKLGELDANMKTIIKKLQNVPEIGDEIKDLIEDIEETGLDMDSFIKDNTTAQSVFNSLFLLFNSQTTIIDAISFIKPNIGNALKAIANGESLLNVVSAYNKKYYKAVKSVLTDIADNTKPITENKYIIKYFGDYIKKAIDFSYDIVNNKFDQSLITKHAELIAKIENTPIIDIIGEYVYKSTYKNTFADLSVFLDVLKFHINRAIKYIPEVQLLVPVKKALVLSSEKLASVSHLMKTNNKFTAAELLSALFTDKIQWKQIPQLLLKKEGADLNGVVDVLSNGNTFINVKETVAKLAALKKSSERKTLAASATQASFAELSESVVIPENSDFTFNDVLPMKSIYKVASQNKEAIANDQFTIKEVGQAVGFDFVSSVNELSNIKTTKAISQFADPEIVNSLSNIVDSSKNGKVDLKTLTDSFNSISAQINPQTKKGLSKGAIIAISVCGVVAVVAVVGIVIHCIRSKKNESDNDQESLNGDLNQV